jgi:hypothetical protein
MSTSNKNIKKNVFFDQKMNKQELLSSIYTILNKPVIQR